MDTTQGRQNKVKRTIHISLAAQDILLYSGYASDRTIGEFVSQLIIEHHDRVQRAKSAAPALPSTASPLGPTVEEVAQELRRLADELAATVAQRAPRSA